MARLLIVHHTPSPALHSLFEAARSGATDPQIEGVDVVGRPYGLYVHGNDDTTGAIRGIEKIVTGLRWQAAQAPVSIVGAPGQADRDACWELGAAVAAGLTLAAG